MIRRRAEIKTVTPLTFFAELFYNFDTVQDNFIISQNLAQI